MLSSLLDLVAPPRCAACGCRAALPWCPDCHESARSLVLHGRCPRCAGRCRSRHDCPLDRGDVVQTVAAFAYEGVVARTVVAAKVGGHHAVWRPLGDHLAAVVDAAKLPVDVVVPVPTEPRRARRRGFDHARLLGHAVAGAIDRPAVDGLRTRRHTPDRGQGAHAPDLPVGAIAALRDLSGHRVLLVDDVLTTGATIRAAAAALVSAGAREVRVAVLARADRDPRDIRSNGRAGRVD